MCTRSHLYECVNRKKIVSMGKERDNRGGKTTRRIELCFKGPDGVTNSKREEGRCDTADTHHVIPTGGRITGRQNGAYPARGAERVGCMIRIRVKVFPGRSVYLNLKASPTGEFHI